MIHHDDNFKDEPKSFSLKNKRKFKDLPKAPSNREKLNDFFRWLDDLWEAKAKVPMDEEYIFLCKNDIQVIKERAAQINTTPLEATSMNPESKTEEVQEAEVIKKQLVEMIKAAISKNSGELTVEFYNRTNTVDIREYVNALGFEINGTRSTGVSTIFTIDLTSKKERLTRTKVDELIVPAYSLSKTIERYQDLNYCVEVAVAQTKPGSSNLNPYVEYTVSVYKLGGN